MPGKTDDEIRYSFYGKAQGQVRKLATGSNNVFICDECIDLCGGILEEELDGHEEGGLDLNDISLLRPREIRSFLDEYVTRQENAEEVLFVAIYSHYKRVISRENMDVDVQKSSILMLSPTGSGRTYLAQTLAKVLGVPFAIANTTALTEAGYVDEDMESILLGPIQATDYDISKAEYGIIYIDEMDKITKRSENVSAARNVSGEGVQQALLEILEGTVASMPPQGGRKHPHQELLQIDTTNILFTCDGASDGLGKIVENRLSVSSIGFNSNVLNRNNIDIDELLRKVLPQDLTKFSLIPEFIGRVSVTISLDTLTEEILVRILSEPRNALAEQCQRLPRLDDMKLEFTQDALLKIAKLASERKTGARGLRSIMESIVIDLMYEVPSGGNIGVCVITKELVDGSGGPGIVYRDAAVPYKAMTQRLRKSSPPEIAQLSIKG